MGRLATDLFSDTRSSARGLPRPRRDRCGHTAQLQARPIRRHNRLFLHDHRAWNDSTGFNFTGLYRHSKSDLDLAVYRAYDPDLGRWLNRDPIAEAGGLNLYEYVAADPINRLDRDGLRSQGFSSATEAARAGALADLNAASGGKLMRGAIEFGGWVCKAKCGGDKPYYFTGPTRGHKGPTPDGQNVSTYSDWGDFEKCSSGDDTIGIHYAHPDGTGIPPYDSRKSDRQQYPLMLAIPTGGTLPGIRTMSHGHWP